MKKKFFELLESVDWIDAGFAAIVAGVIGMVAINAHWLIFLLFVVSFSLVIGTMDDE